jgi:predicted transcriptional regulator
MAPEKQQAMGDDDVYTRYDLIREAHIMTKEAVFIMKLEPQLRADFMAEAQATHRPASQVLRELMRNFVQQQRNARDYDDFLLAKVEAGRVSMRAGVGRSNEELEAEFAARRAAVTAQV